MNNTGNPIGSVSPLDREDNSKVFDRLMLEDVPEVPDRLGRPTKTVASFQVFANNVEVVASQATQDIDEQVTGLQGEIDTRLNNILIAGGRIFDDEAQGRAEVQDDQYFYAKSADPNVSKTIWQRTSSAESERIADEPNLSSFSTSFEYEQQKDDGESFGHYLWALMGNNGNPYLSVEEGAEGVRGVFESYHGLPFFHPVYAQAATLHGRVAYGVTHEGSFFQGGAELLDTDYALAYCDRETGAIRYGIRNDGSFDAGTGVRGTSFAYTVGDVGNREIRIVGETFEEKAITNGGDNWEPNIQAGQVVYLSDEKGPTEIKRVPVDPQNPFSPFIDKVEFWLSGGQSLDQGSTTPPVTIKPPLPGVLLTPNHGVRKETASAVTPADVAALKPGAANFSEPPIISQCWNSKELFINDHALALICATYAVGGQRIDQLSKGTSRYSNGIVAIESAYKICESLQLPLIVPFISWRQGEADIGAGTSYADYYSALLQLQSDYENDIQSIKGQSRSIPILLDQVSSQTAYNASESDIPLCQLNIALENPTLFTCVGPKYDLDYRDGIHVFSEGFFKLGAKFCQAAALIRSGGAWLPVHAVSAERSSNAVTLMFACPNGSLVIDDALVSDPGNYGIRWIDNGDGNAVNVSSVALTNTNEITVTLDAVPTGTGGKIGIADIGISGNPAGPTTGARSCLRDDSPINDTNGDPIYHWACHQQINVTEV